MRDFLREHGFAVYGVLSVGLGWAIGHFQFGMENWIVAILVGIIPASAAVLLFGAVVAFIFPK